MNSAPRDEPRMAEFLSPAQYFASAEAGPRKRFGQHFLAQPATASRIVQSAELSASDVAVEIGPGLGALTRFILPVVHRLYLVEVDRDMAEYLRERLPQPEIASVVEKDVLEFDFAGLHQKVGRRLVLIGNLPYNISSPIMFHLLEAFPVVERAVFMVQKEVGIRFAASPGTKDYGVLSVLLGIYARVTPLFTVGPRQFYPPPKVDSIVLRMDFADESPTRIPFDFLRQFVSKAFQQRRKTLSNSLKGVFGTAAATLDAAYEEIAIDPKRRPETLSPAEFLALAQKIHEKLKSGKQL